MFLSRYPWSGGESSGTAYLWGDRNFRICRTVPNGEKHVIVKFPFKDKAEKRGNIFEVGIYYRDIEPIIRMLADAGDEDAIRLHEALALVKAQADTAEG